MPASATQLCFVFADSIPLLLPITSAPGKIRLAHVPRRHRAPTEPSQRPGRDVRASRARDWLLAALVASPPAIPTN